MGGDVSAASGLAERGRFREALELLEADGPDHLRDELLRARCLAGLGRYEQSLDVLGALTSDATSSSDAATGAEALILRGELHVRLGQPREALTHLSRVFALPAVPALAPRLFVGLANAYTELGDPQRAEDMSDEAIHRLTEGYGSGFTFADPVAYQMAADRKLAIARLAATVGRHRRALYVLEGIEVEGSFGSRSPAVEESSRPRYAALLEGRMPEVDLQAADSLLATGDAAAAAERYRRAGAVSPRAWRRRDRDRRGCR